MSSIKISSPDGLYPIGEEMTAIDTNRVHLGARNQGFGSKILTAFQHWAEARQTRNALNRLTDRELDDIGLTRGDIERIALNA